MGARARKASLQDGHEVLCWPVALCDAQACVAVCQQLIHLCIHERGHPSDGNIEIAASAYTSERIITADSSPS
jgi:hypothetical protein